MIVKSRGLLVALLLSVCAPIQAAEESQPAVPAAGPEVGEVAPVFKSSDDRGQAWDSAEHVGKNYLVVYFYPADFTGGCGKQAETYRDTMNQFAELGVSVIGVSGDAVKNHQLFKEALKLNYTLLADEAGEVADKFGVPKAPGGYVIPFGPDRKPLLNEAGERFRIERQATFARWTFLIGKNGRVLYKNPKVNPANDARQILEFIRNEQTIAEIESLGGQVEIDENSPIRAAISVQMVGCRYKDEDFVGLASLPLLRTVRLGHNITDAGLEHVAGLKNVETLSMPGAPIKGFGLSYLSGLAKLRTLDLESTKVDNASLVHLQGFKELQSLNLGSTLITGQGLGHLKDLTSLESLNLDFTDEALTDEAIGQLKGLTKLKTLILSNSFLTDAGLETLKVLTNLETLNVEGTNVTVAGVADFEKALPRVKVIR